jgi:hypothetical protein
VGRELYRARRNLNDGNCLGRLEFGITVFSYRDGLEVVFFTALTTCVILNTPFLLSFTFNFLIFILKIFIFYYYFNFLNLKFLLFKFLFLLFL